MVLGDEEPDASAGEIIAKLRKENRQLRQLIESADVGFGLRSADPPRFVYASRQYGRLFGVDERAPLTRQGGVELIHPDDRARLAAEYLAPADALDHAEIEVRRLLEDGSVRWLRLSSRPVVDAGGPVSSVVTMVEDITERKTATIALEASERRFLQFAGSVRLGFALISVETSEYVYVNDAWFDIFGLDPAANVPRAELIATVLERVHPDDVALLRAVVPNATTPTVEPVGLEYRLTGQDGQLRWLHASLFPVIEVEGARPTLIASITEDVTHRKLAEHAALLARDVAERASRAKSEFVSRMSHELRTPLNAVLGFGQLLEMDLAGTEHSESIGFILTGGRHLLRLVDDVLDVARLEAGTMSVSIEAVDIATLVEDALQLMAPLATAAGVHLRGLAGDQQITVLADAHRFRQIVLNLLSNAIKYHRRDGHVWIDHEVIGERVAITVHDDGPGISVEMQARLFAPFDRLGAESTGIEGTGLGLALTRSLAELMDGTVSFESEPGRGSMFTVTLPRAPGEPGPSHATAAPVGAVPPVTRTLLYIQEDESNARAVEELLRQRPGWRLEHVPLSSIGIDVAQACQPDLLLLDADAPESRGLDVLRQLRLDPATRRLPIVVLASPAAAGDLGHLASAEATTRVIPPTDIRALLTILDDAHG